ncbi:MAG: SAM-dependent methyltransferase [Candidatus Latescibacterota bacterium]
MSYRSLSRSFLLAAMTVLAVLGLSPAGYPQQSTLPAVDSANQELKEIRTPDIYFVPTPQEVVDKMLELAKVTKDDVIYDLGCGDGRIVITAAKKYGCRGVGYDIDPKRVMESMNNVREQGVMDLVRIEQKDVFTLDLSKASVITLYLLPSLNVKLIPQLQKVRPGTRIVSHDFDLQGVVTQDKAVRVRTDDDMEHTVYLWTAPLKANEKKE